MSWIGCKFIAVCHSLPVRTLLLCTPILSRNRISNALWKWDTCLLDLWLFDLEGPLGEMKGEETRFQREASPQTLLFISGAEPVMLSPCPAPCHGAPASSSHLELPRPLHASLLRNSDHLFVRTLCSVALGT